MTVRIPVVAPTTLTTAFLITQFFLLLIVYVGILALKYGEKSYSPFSGNPRLATRSLPSFALGFSLITLACITFSQDFVLLSKPAFGGIEFPSLSRGAAFLIVFVLDIVGSGFLMVITGGSKDSPFSAVPFALPALSIFLRESPTRFFFYTALAVAVFMFFPRASDVGKSVLENPKHIFAFQVVTLGCLALSTLVGYATRPL